MSVETGKQQEGLLKAAEAGEQQGKLLNAAQAGDLDIVHKLIQEDAVDINYSSSIYNDKTSLGVAAEYGHKGVVQVLLEHGADATKGSTAPILDAARNGHVQVVMAILEKSGDINAFFKIYDEEKTLLMVAAENGHDKLVDTLLKDGAETNLRTKDDYYTYNYEDDREPESVLLNSSTALTLAAGNGEAQVVQALLECGAADVNVDNTVPVIEAARSSDAAIVKLLIAHGAHVNLAEPHRKDSALGIAADRGNKEIVLDLIKAGANIDHQNEQQQTPLIMATAAGNTEMAMILIEHKADVNLMDENEYTALINAVKFCTVELVIMLLENGANITPIKDGGGDGTCLGWAASIGDNEVVTALIKHGADLNYLNIHHETALSRAAGGGHMDAVNNLLEHGAQIDLGTPVTKAAEKGEREIVALLLQQGASAEGRRDSTGDSALILAVISMTPSFGLGGLSNLGTVKLLVEHGADIDAQNDVGRSALFYAALFGQKEAVEYLLEKGANANITTAQGKTPLMMAVQEGFVHVVKVLLKHNAEVDLKDREGQTALSIAARHGQGAAARVLAEYGAQRSGSSLAEEAFFGNTATVEAMITEQGIPVDQGIAADSWTPLILAAKNGKADTVTALLDHGADINNKGVGTTALIEASKLGHIEVVNVLLNRDADMSIDTFDEGITALDAAVMNGFLEVLEALIASGADVNQTSQQLSGMERSPLMAAAGGGHIEVVKSLLKRGADVNLYDTHYDDAFNYASKNGHSEIAALIAEHMAPDDLNDKLIKSVYLNDFDTLNNILDSPACNVDHIGKEFSTGSTALMMAARNEDVTALKALLNRQPDVNIKDSDNKTALDIAVNMNNKAAVDILLKHGAKVSKQSLALAAELENANMLDLLEAYRTGM